MKFGLLKVTGKGVRDETDRFFIEMQINSTQF